MAMQVLRGEEDLRELLDDDDEDEDFTLDWDELMGANPFGEGGPALHADLVALSAGPIAARQAASASSLHVWA